MNFQELKNGIADIIVQSEARTSVSIMTPDGDFEHNGDAVYASASLIKVPILMTGLQQADKGILDLEAYAAIDAAQMAGGAGVLQALSPAVKVTLMDLLTLMIIVSDNTATNMAIKKIGKNHINALIQAMGLKNTVLERKMMDFEEIRAGKDNMTTANDIAACLQMITGQKLLSYESCKKALKILGNQQFKNKLPLEIDHNKISVANKTGELPGLQHDCAIFRYERNSVIAAVLMDGITDLKKGLLVFAEIGKLINSYLLCLPKASGR